MEDILPALHLAVVIKQILGKHWKDIIIYYRLHPFLRTVFLRPSAEITVSDAEPFPQGLIPDNLFVQLNNL